MIKCPQCDHECLDGTLFCDDCGCDLSAVEAQPAAAAPPTATPPAATPPVSPGPAPQATSAVPASSPAPQLTAAGTASPRLVVLRGVTPNEEYKIWEGDNYIGRNDEQPVDIDLEPQETPDRQLASRQHAVVQFSGGVCSIKDLGSLNGTFVNRQRLQAESPLELHDGDVIQTGTVHLKFLAN